MYRDWFSASLFAVLLVACGTTGSTGNPEPVTGADSSSRSIAITPDGAIVVVVNSDSHSITFVDSVTQTALVELPVGVDPRAVAVSPDGRLAYVANQGSDSVSIVDLKARRVRADVAVGRRPVGLAVSPDGRLIAVAELGEDSVRLIRSSDLATSATISVADRPGGLAFTPDGRRLLVAHLLRGDVTVVSMDDLSSMVISTWANVAPAPAVIVNAAGTRAYLAQTMAHGLGFNTQFDNTVFAKVSVLDLGTMTHRTSEHISLPEKDRPVGLPWAVALTKDDSELWVVNAASNDVSVLDVSDPSRVSRVAHVAVGDNPRGIALTPDGRTAFVNNTLAGTVSVIDTATYAVTNTVTLTDIPLPPILLRGKRLFHSSARSDLARARWIACNTCHVEGEHDGRTWQLQFIGSIPPGAEPVIRRNTTSLLGMIETYPLRWSAEWDESADSEFSVRFEQFGTGLIPDGAMNPTRGAPNQGRSEDLDALAAFIDSLAASPRVQRLTAAELRGKEIFESAATGCADCHPTPLYTDLKVHDVGTADATGEWFGPLIDTPTLRFLYDSAPYLHDGSAPTLFDVLTVKNPAGEHGGTSHLSEQDIQDLIAFLLALPHGPSPMANGN